MDSRELKKILAGVGIAGLVTGAGLGLPGCVTAGTSGWSAKTSAVSTEEVKQAPAPEVAPEAPPVVEEKEKKPSGKSGWSGSK